jgi:hypothetical protein
MTIYAFWPCLYSGKMHFGGSEVWCIMRNFGRYALWDYALWTILLYLRVRQCSTEHNIQPVKTDVEPNLKRLSAWTRGFMRRTLTKVPSFFDGVWEILTGLFLDNSWGSSNVQASELPPMIKLGYRLWRIPELRESRKYMVYFTFSHDDIWCPPVRFHIIARHLIQPGRDSGLTPIFCRSAPSGLQGLEKTAVFSWSVPVYRTVGSPRGAQRPDGLVLPLHRGWRQSKARDSSTKHTVTPARKKPWCVGCWAFLRNQTIFVDNSACQLLHSNWYVISIPQTSLAIGDKIADE